MCTGNDIGNLVPQRMSEHVWLLWPKILPSLKGTAKLIGLYGDSIMSVQHFRKWCKEFETVGETGFTKTIHNLRFICCIGIIWPG